MNTEYQLVGQVSANCDKNEYHNTYDYLLNKALYKYGEGVDIINITKDYEGSFFSTKVYINAHVIKYLNTVDFQTYNFTNDEPEILDGRETDVSVDGFDGRFLHNHNNFSLFKVIKMSDENVKDSTVLISYWHDGNTIELWIDPNSEQLVWDKTDEQK